MTLVAGLEFRTKCASTYSHLRCLPLAQVEFYFGCFRFVSGCFNYSSFLKTAVRQNNLLFSLLIALGIRLLAILLSICIELITASDPRGRS